MEQYIQKSALVEEIDNLENTYKKCPTHNSYEEGLKEGRLIGYKDTLHKINTLEVKEVQEEPVSEDLEEASKEWLRPQLDKSYANYGEAKMMELTHFDGYAMLDAIEFGAKWQMAQMIKDATAVTVHVDANGYPYIPQMELYDYDKDVPLAKEGDKYKVVLIKED